MAPMAYVELVDRPRQGCLSAPAFTGLAIPRYQRDADMQTFLKCGFRAGGRGTFAMVAPSMVYGSGNAGRTQRLHRKTRRKLLRRSMLPSFRIWTPTG